MIKLSYLHKWEWNFIIKIEWKINKHVNQLIKDFSDLNIIVSNKNIYDLDKKKSLNLFIIINDKYNVLLMKI